MSESRKSIGKMVTDTEDQMKHLDLVRKLHGLPPDNAVRIQLAGIKIQKAYTYFKDPDYDEPNSRDGIRIQFQELSDRLDNSILSIKVMDFQDPDTYPEAAEHIDLEIAELERLLDAVQEDEDLEEIRTHLVRMKITELKHSKYWSQITDYADRRAFDRVQKRLYIEFSDLEEDIMSIRKKEYEDSQEQDMRSIRSSIISIRSIIGGEEGGNAPPPY